MASYLPSSAVKRLLRYVLLRLDLLEEDDLDLDTIDITWGKLNILEYKDVRLKTKKLAKQLELPPKLKFLQARVLRLRITLPTDFLNSGIRVQVDGVRIKVQLEDHNAATHGLGKSWRERTQRPTQDPGGDGGLPTTEDLAKSFLAEEPLEEKKELEAAVLSQSRNLQESDVFSDSGDSESGAGTGTALALPSFLAGFLQGLKDRFQLEVSNIEFEFETVLESPESTFALPRKSNAALVVRAENLELLALSSRSRQSPGIQNTQGVASDQKDGKRNVMLRNLSVRLLSEPSLFANFSRAASTTSPDEPRSPHSERLVGSKRGSEAFVNAEVSSPGATWPKSTSPEASVDYSDVAAGFTKQVRPPMPGRSRNRRRPSIDSVRSVEKDDVYPLSTGSPQERQPSLTSSVPPSPSLQSSMASNNFDDQANLYLPEEEELSLSHLEGAMPLSEAVLSESQPHFPQQGGPASPRSSSQSVSPRLVAAAPYGSSPNSSGIAESGHHSLAAPQHSANRMIPRDATITAGHGQIETSVPSDLQRAPSPASSGSQSIELGPADLEQSKLFTHDQAESLYMSALSEAPAGNMPGGWDSSSTDEPVSGRSRPSQTDLDDQRPSKVGVVEEMRCETPRPHSPVTEPTVARTQTLDETYDSRQQHLNPQTTIPPAGVGSTHSSSDYPPNLVMKDVATLDQASVWLPSRTESVPQWGESESIQQESYVHGLDMSQSTSRHFPGSFSQYADHTTGSRRLNSREPQTPKHSIASQGMPAVAMQSENQSLDVSFGSAVFKADIPVLLVVLQIIKQLQDATVQERDSKKKHPQAGDKEGGNKSWLLNLAIGSVSIQVVERILCTTWTEGAAVLEPASCPSPELPLLRIDLRHINVVFQTPCELSVTIRKLILGVDEEPMLSFDASMRSTVSVKEPSDKDITVNYKSLGNGHDLSITTLPIRLVVDVQKIDEALSCFGGLSGVLELSNSVTSANAGPVSPVRTQQRPRGVRFAGEPGVHLGTPLSGWRVNARFGGFNFSLTGRTCGVSLETTSIKVVGRESGIGASFSQLRLTGPYFEASTIVPPLSVNMTEARLEFAFTPDERDLTKLVSLITPSSDKFEEDDDILLDTLLRQRKKGSLLRVVANNVGVDLLDLKAVNSMQYLGEELSKLANVAKYLPEDDRPGLLSMLTIANLRVCVEVGGAVGGIRLDGRNLRMGHVGIPPLLAFAVDTISMDHGQNTRLISDVLGSADSTLPMVMVRFIGDEMVPTVKVKLFNICFEYHVSSVMAMIGVPKHATSEDVAMNLASSVATITGKAAKAALPSQSSQGGLESPSRVDKSMHLDLTLRECAIGLNPQGLASKALFLLSDTHLASKLPSENIFSASLELRKAYILVIDDIASLTTEGTAAQRSNTVFTNRTVLELCERGYVNIGTLSKATIVLRTAEDLDSGRMTDVRVKNELFFLETCADSTQTVTSILGALSPPKPQSSAVAYRTQVVSMEDMMASFTGQAFPEPQVANSASMDDEDLTMGLDHVGSFYDPGTELEHHDLMSSQPNIDLASLRPVVASTILDNKSFAGNTVRSSQTAYVDEELQFEDDFYAIQAGRKNNARKWDSSKNEYGVNSETQVAQSPFKIHVREVHFIWNLFDGYDWVRTRQTIEKAVNEVEAKAEERRRGQRLAPTAEDEDEEVVGDFLFNSIWIEVPANREPGELARQINRNMDDLVSESESYAATTTTMSPTRSSVPRQRRKRLRLQRSRQHKIAFELKGISADVYVYPPRSGETQSSVDVRVADLDIFDRVPSSTWRKFATYMKDAGEREEGKPMVHLNILNVKPIEDLAASELVIQVTVLPLRLHVDQDALDFMTRFFEFKDDQVKDQDPPGGQPFLQRLEVNTVLVKLDYKPKKVDYAGLRSGHTTEFMNFFILDSADIALRHCIIYGISGFDKLHKTLNDIWMPDVKRNQLPGVLAGLAPVRSLVNVGSGMRDLVYVPMREYQKDGRIVRSVQKGAVAFARTTTSELARLGAKIAIGTQNVLQGAEGVLSPASPAAGASRRHGDGDWDDACYPFDEEPSGGEEEARAVSHYADQPIGVLAGIRGAARSLERDLLTTRDAIVAIPGEVMESESAGGAAKAIVRRAPTVILRPAIAASKAVGMTLLGAGNALDSESRRRIDEKYKRY